MKELLELVARRLVDRPDDIVVTEVDDEDGEPFFELRVAPEDLGKVIGKQGRTARAIRTLLGAAGAKQRKRFGFDILEEE